MKKTILSVLILAVLVVIACSNTTTQKNEKESPQLAEKSKKSTKELSKEFKAYWYNGEAEITSYELEQARYGEIRKGHSVLIYVTEDFLTKEQVKADTQHSKNTPILKLNSTKKFMTGIYPYSTMESTFYPVSANQHAIKVSCSVQEWCGHVYTQLNNRKQYEVLSHSYFQNEADQEFKLDKTLLENELWTKIRISPQDLPIGEIEIIPSFEFCRLKHKQIKSYRATASMQQKNNKSQYTIIYPELDRELSITFASAFPYEIDSWSETFISGFGANAKKMTTKATKIKRIKSAYWSKNGNKNLILRDSLGLKQ